MKKVKMYVVLQDEYSDLGEGYSESRVNQFICIEPSFEAARKCIEALVEHIESDYTIFEEDWDFITIDIDDYCNTRITYRFKPIEIEVP